METQAVKISPHRKYSKILYFEELLISCKDFLFYINNIISTIPWTLVILGVIIIWFILYVLRKIYGKYFWVEIGILEEINTYDLYSGKPLSQRSIKTTSRTDGGPSLVNDRKYLIYTPRNGRNEIVLDKREFNTLIPSLVTLQTDDIWLNKRRAKVFCPDGSHLFAYDCGDEVAQYLTNAYGARITPYRIGVQTHYDKVLSRDRFRYSKTYTRIIKSLNPRHAVCILVNRNSVAAVGGEVAPANFRPHLVVNIPVYMEDKIKSLRIGNVEFSSPLPCIIDRNVNFNPHTRVISDGDNEPYPILRRTRRLKDVFPMISSYSLLPAFGINLIVSKDGEFGISDRIYAKF